MCKLLLQIRSMCSFAVAGEQRRDLTLINQMVDLLSTLAEKVHMLKATVVAPRPMDPELLSRILQAAQQKLSAGVVSKWQRLENEISYWNDDEKEVSSFPFLNSCEALLFLCDDVMEAIHSVQESYGPHGFAPESLIELTLSLLPQLHVNFNFSQ